MCPPEIILRALGSPQDLHDLACDAVVIGCGLGEPAPVIAEVLLDWLEASITPAVIDADALNLIARSGRIGIFKGNQVLTPHPGEFRRLAPDLAGEPREAAARAFASRCPATLLLKGARSLIARNGQPLWCNATGTPGMATGGQGDLLSGMIGAGLAGGLPPAEAAALGAWLCGRAAEISLSDSPLSEESLTSSDVALHLGRAFRDWKSSTR
jgi:NAD(P)H-hydrate epimerase